MLAPALGNLASDRPTAPTGQFTDFAHAVGSAVERVYRRTPDPAQGAPKARAASTKLTGVF